MTNKNKYLLDTERLKKLAPIMQECGVESEDILLSVNDYQELRSKCSVHDLINWQSKLPTFDYADLESVFTDEDWGTMNYLMWAIEDEHVKRIFEKPFWEKVVSLYRFAVRQRGQAKLEAMADLIILLHENGVGLKKKEEAKND